MIYIIGGTPRSGKTTLAKKLSKNLRISWVSGDALESIRKYYTSKKEYSKRFPKDIMRRKTKNSNDLMYTKYTSEEIMAAYLTQGASVWQSIELFIDSLIGEDIDYIVEGYQISPHKVAELQKKYPKQVRSIFLVKEDPAKILSGALAHTAENDWFKTKTTDPEIYTKICEMLSLFGKQMKKEATASKLKVINTDIDFALQIRNAYSYLVK
jgi:2-phosphoglycerate kinase